MATVIDWHLRLFGTLQERDVAPLASLLVAAGATATANSLGIEEILRSAADGGASILFHNHRSLDPGLTSALDTLRLSSELAWVSDGSVTGGTKLWDAATGHFLSWSFDEDRIDPESYRTNDPENCRDAKRWMKRHGLKGLVITLDTPDEDATAARRASMLSQAQVVGDATQRSREQAITDEHAELLSHTTPSATRYLGGDPQAFRFILAEHPADGPVELPVTTANEVGALHVALQINAMLALDGHHGRARIVGREGVLAARRWIDRIAEVAGIEIVATVDPCMVRDWLMDDETLDPCSPVEVPPLSAIRKALEAELAASEWLDDTLDHFDTAFSELVIDVAERLGQAPS